eukprot:7499048-Karenia_brevis.AAC.1
MRSPNHLLVGEMVAAGGDSVPPASTTTNDSTCPHCLLDEANEMIRRAETPEQKSSWENHRAE